MLCPSIFNIIIRSSKFKQSWIGLVLNSESIRKSQTCRLDWEVQTHPGEDNGTPGEAIVFSRHGVTLCRHSLHTSLLPCSIERFGHILTDKEVCRPLYLHDTFALQPGSTSLGQSLSPVSIPQEVMPALIQLPIVNCQLKKHHLPTPQCPVHHSINKHQRQENTNICLLKKPTGKDYYTGRTKTKMICLLFHFLQLNC